jgi:hypothetical protein
MLFVGFSENHFCERADAITSPAFMPTSVLAAIGNTLKTSGWLRVGLMEPVYDPPQSVIAQSDYGTAGSQTVKSPTCSYAKYESGSARRCISAIVADLAVLINSRH